MARSTIEHFTPKLRADTRPGKSPDLDAVVSQVLQLLS
jgi:hypothetical protein